MILKYTCLILLAILMATDSMAVEHNGFETGAMQIVKVMKRDEEMASLTDVRHVNAPGEWRGDTLVIGSIIDGQAIAYPLAILMWHWIINDVVADRPIAIVFCPLCGTAALYERSSQGDVLTFGASGLIFEDDMLLYDLETESLWSWGTEVAVAGSLRGTGLSSIPGKTTTLGDWVDHHPDSLVVEAPTSATGIDYRVTPNNTSALGESVFSGLQRNTAQINQYTPVVGLKIDDQAIAIPATEVLGTGRQVTLKVGSDVLTVSFDVERQSFVTTGDVEFTTTDLRTWLEHNPSTDLYSTQTE